MWIANAGVKVAKKRFSASLTPQNGVGDFAGSIIMLSCMQTPQGDIRKHTMEKSSTNGPMDEWTNGPMDQWSNGPIDQWSNGPMDQWQSCEMSNFLHR